MPAPAVVEPHSFSGHHQRLIADILKLLMFIHFLGIKSRVSLHSWGCNKLRFRPELLSIRRLEVYVLSSDEVSWVPALMMQCCESFLAVTANHISQLFSYPSRFTVFISLLLFIFSWRRWDYFLWMTSAQLDVENIDFFLRGVRSLKVQWVVMFSLQS